MTPAPRRPFTIADCMILVVAFAVSAAILRAYLPGFFRLQAARSSIFPDPWGALRAYFWFSGVGSCVAIPVTGALLVIRVLPPRPRWARLAIQPGFLGCVAVLVALIPGLAEVLPILHRPGFAGSVGFEQVWGQATRYCSSAAFGAWFALAMCRRWRVDPSWIDRSGRILGVFWLLLPTSFMAYECILRLVGLISSGG